MTKAAIQGISPFFAVSDVPRSVAFAAPLADTSDGLRGFEIADPDGYVLFFGRPR